MELKIYNNNKFISSKLGNLYCFTCAKTKNTYNIFNPISKHSTKLFKLIHFNLNERFSIKLIEKNWYYTNFIDNYIRYS